MSNKTADNALCLPHCRCTRDYCNVGVAEDVRQRPLDVVRLSANCRSIRAPAVAVAVLRAADNGIWSPFVRRCRRRWHFFFGALASKVDLSAVFRSLGVAARARFANVRTKRLQRARSRCNVSLTVIFVVLSLPFVHTRLPTTYTSHVSEPLSTVASSVVSILGNDFN